MFLSAKENRKHVLQLSKIHRSGSKLALATFHILLYLWRAGKLVAQRTYGYSAKIKNTGNNLLRRRGVGMLVERRSLGKLSEIIPPFKSSWQRMKSFDWKHWRDITVTGYNGNNLHLKRASHILSRAKLAAEARLNGVYGIGTWKRSLKHFTAANLASKALSKLTKFGRRHGVERQKSDKRRSFKFSSRLSRPREHALTSLTHSEFQKSEDAGSEHSKTALSISWGEIVQRNDSCSSKLCKEHNRRLTLYKKIPLKSVSRVWGQFNQLELPTWLRKPALGLYVWLFNCTLEDAAVQDLSYYRNLSEFFRRQLRAGIRPIDGAHILTSPADGRVLNCGVVNDGLLEQVKGVTYSLLGFLGPMGTLLSYKKNSAEGMSVNSWDQLLYSPQNKLYHCVIYLAPGDYHRFHSPADWNVYMRRHFPGELFSVSPGIARWLQGLFNFNERAVYAGTWTHGFFSMTAVGATNVGSINVHFDETLRTNSTSTFPSGSFYDRNFASDKKRSITLKKGQLVGDFNLGSTIVLLFEAPDNFIFSVKPGQRLRYGQGLGGCLKQLQNHGIKRDK